MKRPGGEFDERFFESLTRIQEKLAGDLQPVRPLPPPLVLWALCLSVCAAILVAGTIVMGTAGWRGMSVLQRCTVGITLIAGLCLLALLAIRLMTPGSRHTARSNVLPAAVIMGFLLAVSATFSPGREPAFVATGKRCLWNGLVYAAPTGLLLSFILRRGAGLSPKISGASAGGLAGLVGLGVLEMSCPDRNLFHIAVWHSGALALSILAGYLSGAVVDCIAIHHG